MRHRSGCRDAVCLVGNGTGGSGATADICGARAENGGVRALRAARAELADRSAVSGAYDTRRLGRYAGLMVELHKHICFDKLSLRRFGAHGDKRLAGEYDSSLGNSPHITLKAEVLEILKEFFVEYSLGAEIFNVLGIEMQVVDIIYDLFKSGGYGISGVVGIVAVKYVKIDVCVAQAAFFIAVRHGQLVKITKHCKVSVDVFHLFDPLNL